MEATLEENSNSTSPITNDQNSTRKSTLTFSDSRSLDHHSLINGRFTISNNTLRWREDESLVTGDVGIEEVAFESSTSDLWIKVIAERAELSMEIMGDIMLENAQNLAPEASITESGTRIVNGKELGWLYMQVETEGIPFTFYNHFYTGPEGTVQIHGWTFSNLMDEYESRIEEIVSSFRVE